MSVKLCSGGGGSVELRRLKIKGERMKEVVTYVALIIMEFNDEATCNAFYKNYNSTEGHTPTCSRIVRFEGDYFPSPLPRPEVIREIVQ